jgi:hypothetical protein
MWMSVKLQLTASANTDRRRHPPVPGQLAPAILPALPALPAPPGSAHLDSDADRADIALQAAHLGLAEAHTARVEPLAARIAVGHAYKEAREAGRQNTKHNSARHGLKIWQWHYMQEQRQYTTQGWPWHTQGMAACTGSPRQYAVNTQDVQRQYTHCWPWRPPGMAAGRGSTAPGHLRTLSRRAGRQTPQAASQPVSGEQQWTKQEGFSSRVFQESSHVGHSCQPSLPAVHRKPSDPSTCPQIPSSLLPAASHHHSHPGAAQTAPPPRPPRRPRPPGSCPGGPPCCAW